jgi:DNA repair exonuclease SbcCD ATPase subunit
MIETNNTAAAPSDLDAEIERRVALREPQREAAERAARRAALESEVRAEVEGEAQLQRAIEQRDEVIRRRDVAQAEVDALGVETSQAKAKFETAWQSLAAKSLELTSLHGSVAAAEATVQRLTPDPIRDLHQGRATLAQILAAIDTLQFDENGDCDFFGRRVATTTNRQLVAALLRAISKLKGKERVAVDDHLYALSLSAGRHVRDMR